MKRRSKLSVVTVMVIASAASASAPAAATATSADAWGQVSAHATRDNYNPSESRLTSTNAAKAKPQWRVPLGAAKCTSPSEPLVGGNRLITAAAYRISGYDATTGVLKWRTPDLGKRHISLAAIVGTRVIAQYRDCQSGKSFLTALDTSTGKTIYNKPIATLMFNVTVDKGMVFGGIWEAAASNYAVRAYRVADGSLAWGRQGQISGNPAVSAGGRIFVFSDEYPSGAVDITTGKAAWSDSDACDSPVGASPDGTKIYMRCGPTDALQLVDAATGKVLATFPDPGSTFGFATDGKRIYMRTYSPEGVVAIDALNGRKVWSSTFGDRAPYMFSVAGGVLYGLRSYGFPVAAMNAATGEVIALDARTSAITGQPVVANGRLYGVTGSAITAYAP